MKKSRIKSTQTALHFKRWNRAAYAISLSIGRVVNIGVLAQSIAQRLDEKNDLVHTEETSKDFYSLEEDDESQNKESLLLELLILTLPVLLLITKANSFSSKCFFKLNSKYTVSFSSLFFSTSSPFFIFFLLFFTTLFSTHSYAQESDTLFNAEVEIKEVVIQANRLDFLEKKAPKNIDVITQQEIKRVPAMSFADLLSYQSGIDVRQRGPMGIQSDLGINGSNFSQSQLLINGIKMSDPQTGHHLMNIAVPLAFVQQIEIIKGGAAKRFGQNTFGGAVNIHTKIPEEDALYINLLAGDYNLYTAAVGASFGKKKYRQVLAVDHSQSSGYRHNTDFLLSNLFYQGKYKINKTEVMDVLLAYSDRSFGANGFYATPAATEQYEEIQTVIGSLSYKKEIDNWDLKSRLSWRRNNDQYDYIRKLPMTYRNIHQSNTYSVELNAIHKNSLGETAIGVEYRREDIWGNEIRNDTNNISRLNGKYRDNLGLFGEHKFTFLEERLILNPGFYAAWYSDFGSHFFPALDASYLIKEKLSFFTSVGRSYRIPAFYDQYYDSPSEKGNPDLKAENAFTSEIGTRFFYENVWSLKAAYLYRDNKRIIDWVEKNGTDYWSAVNYSDLLTQAFDFSIQYTPNIQLTRSFTLQEISASYYLLNQIRNAEESLPSRYVLDYLKNQLVAKLSLRLFEKGQITIIYRNIERVKEKNYQLLDVRGSYQFSHFSLFVDVNNLLNTSYVEILTPMPARWVKFGANIKIGL